MPAGIGANVRKGWPVIFNHIEITTRCNKNLDATGAPRRINNNPLDCYSIAIYTFF